MTDDLDPLSRALRDVADEDAHRMSSSIEARLLAEFRARHRRPSMSRGGRAFGVALAAALLAAVSIPVWRVARGGFRPGAAVGSERRELTTPFLPLPFSSVPSVNGQLVRIELPKASLLSMGVAPIDSFDALGSGTITADVLVGDDGLARAIRFIRPVVPQRR
jgi:hypothetical protein